MAFTQYPQFSCSTTGSSLNELWRAAERTGLRDAFAWSIIDRWPVHDGFIASMTETVREGLEQFDPADRDRVLILFSAHSLPLDVIDRGDAYPQEIGASVQAVVERLGRAQPVPPGLQSEVGPVRWLGPQHRAGASSDSARGARSTCWSFRSRSPATTSRRCRSSTASTARWRAGPASPTTSAHPRSTSGRSSWTRWRISCASTWRRAGVQPLYRTRCPGCVNPQCRQILNPVGGGCGREHGGDGREAGADAASGWARTGARAPRLAALVPPQRPAHRIQHPPHQPVRHLPDHAPLPPPTAPRAAPAPWPPPARPPARPAGGAPPAAAPPRGPASAGRAARALLEHPLGVVERGGRRPGRGAAEPLQVVEIEEADPRERAGLGLHVPRHRRGPSRAARRRSGGHRRRELSRRHDRPRRERRHEQQRRSRRAAPEAPPSRAAWRPTRWPAPPPAPGAG